MELRSFRQRNAQYEASSDATDGGGSNADLIAHSSSDACMPPPSCVL
jgi:hypothetical protein